MAAIFTVLERVLPALVIVFVLAVLIWIGYLILSRMFRGAADEVQKTTIDNAEWLESKISSMSDEELHEIVKAVAKIEDDVDLD